MTEISEFRNFLRLFTWLKIYICEVKIMVDFLQFETVCQVCPDLCPDCPDCCPYDYDTYDEVGVK